MSSTVVFLWWRLLLAFIAPYLVQVFTGTSGGPYIFVISWWIVWRIIFL